MPAGSKTAQPGLALSWYVSSDGLTWTVNLHPEVTFHNDEVLTAAAVVFNFQRWWDPQNDYHNGDFPYFEFIFGFKGNANTLLTGIDSPGENQVAFHLTHKDARLPMYLAMPTFSIASPLAIQAGTIDSHPVGTGPFRFVEWVHGDHVLIEANSDYWDQVPFLNNLVFNVVPTAYERISAIQNNLAQVAYDIPGYDCQTANQDLNLTVFSGYALNIGYLGINF